MLQLLELEGSLARKRRFHVFNWSNSKEASHESFVFTNQGCDLNVRDLQETLCFFRVDGASVAEKSWLACATVSGVVALAGKCFQTARAVELMVPGDLFSSLMLLCYCVLHVLRHFVHWNHCIEEMRSCLDLWKCEGSLLRKLRFHLFNSWNSKDASHESFAFISSTVGI